MAIHLDLDSGRTRAFCESPNPADAVRTGALLGLQGTTAFGSASLAFLRFMKGPVGAGCLLSLSVLLWIAVPFAWAVRRLGKADM